MITELNTKVFFSPEYAIAVKVNEIIQYLNAKELNATDNQEIKQLLSDCQDVIGNSVLLDEKGHLELMKRINAVLDGVTEEKTKRIRLKIETEGAAGVIWLDCQAGAKESCFEWAIEVLDVEEKSK